jgi:HD superfamily phosphohydrolase
MERKQNKFKLLNDPVHGFIRIPDALVFDLMEQPEFQRLRRIKQLGMTSLVYPGALHTRFHHALGAMYLMTTAVESLRSKGVDISSEEASAVNMAILLHDIGHGPFSHALEHSIVSGVPHEAISLLFMEHLNARLNHQLDLAIRIFRGDYHKPFLHQLVSSQLDVDRLDYLKRDSFFTGVSEGIISTERIIAMLTVVDGQLAVEEKGLYSVEKFVLARRLMYWQVYYHKTTVAAEQMIVHILRRARYLAEHGADLFASPALLFFLKNHYSLYDFTNNSEVLKHFSALDDDDIQVSTKQWAHHSDRVLSTLCRMLVNRQLFRTDLATLATDSDKVEGLLEKIAQTLQITLEEAQYFVAQGTISNRPYGELEEQILISDGQGRAIPISEALRTLSLPVMNEVMERHFFCYPKQLA